jgi:protein-S-isoprenylcysteine O-methyltransferase Ste14
MNDNYFNSTYGEQPIITGYVGAAAIVIFSLAIVFFKTENLQLFSIQIQRSFLLLLMIVATFIAMLIANYFGKQKYIRNGWLKTERIKIKITSQHLVISTLYRFSTLLLVFYLMFWIVNRHYYFADDSFQIAKFFFNVFFTFYIILGIPYIFLTLKYRWSIKYDLNDYSLNIMLLFKGMTYIILGSFFNKKTYSKKAKILILSRRVRKILLTYLVIFFFLTLMIKFLDLEFMQFDRAANVIFSFNKEVKLFNIYEAYYVMIYHLLFVIDVSLAIIGYTVANRWLDNRTKSVDTTVGGWIVALMCYPPMNSGFTEKFINYNLGENHSIITSEIGKMIIMALTLFLFTIYVWATVAFSLKFSNLTNRGIVTTGPYSIVRHPAYISKNLAWWLENSYVLSNFWATVALFAWNAIYILRALTEERHLKKDPKYLAYCQKVKYRFIPGVF